MPEVPGPQAAQVFLSYSRSDREAATAVRVALEQAGLSVFHDVESIREGDQWMKRLEDALAACSSFVVLVGRDGVRRWVGAEVQVAVNRHFGPQDDAERLPIFPVLLGDQDAALPSFLSLFQAATWSALDPVPATLLEAIEARASLLNPPEPFDGCPFLGLNAFRRKDAQLFFGRRQETLDALACLGSQQDTNPERLEGACGINYHRWLQIEGSSGAGKSSLVHAGMLPLIEHGALWPRTGFDKWKILGPMMPGKDPLRKLAEVFERGLIEKPENRDTFARVTRLMRDPSALATALIDFKEEQTAYLLIIDQFEELFTFADAESRQRFDGLLASALQDPACPLFVISTVRADFLDRYELLPCLQAAYNKVGNNYLLPTISERGLREVIALPARLAGVDVTEVTAAILQEARGEVGALPLVENALFVLWNKRTGNRLSGDEFEKQKGIAGMLSTQADALLTAIEEQVPGGRRAALELLLRLTRINDEGRHTRQRVGRKEAVEVAGNGNVVLGEKIVQLLSGGAQSAFDDQPSGALRLITAHSENDQQYVDLIHETLIRARVKDAETAKSVGYWPTLFDYVEKNRDNDILRQQLKLRANSWTNSKGFRYIWRLAYFDLWSYRSLSVPPSSLEGKFLSTSRFVSRVGITLLLILSGIIGQSLWWIRSHDLPFESMATVLRFRLGYEPVPALVPVGEGSVDMGERDPSLLQKVAAGDRSSLGDGGPHVGILKPFLIGKYEVTYDEFDFFVWSMQVSGDMELRFPATAKGGRGNQPVVNVTWYEASRYSTWFGSRIKQDCRLPTEAEWEYSARAGSKTAYPWGNEVETNRANCKLCGSRWDGERAAPVGRFGANRFGLFDTSGNVWEWTCSAWRDKFDGSEEKCEGQSQKGTRVVRGGAWLTQPIYAISSARGNFVPDGRFVDAGFRVVCQPK